MQGHRVLIAVAGAGLAGCTAISAPVSHAGPSPAPTAGELVAARSGGMKMTVAALAAAGRAAEDEMPLARATLATGGLKSFAEGLPGLFREDTAAISGTRAAPAIWTDAPGWAARIAQYQQATASLHAAALANDRTAYAAALDMTRNACKACHDPFRAD